MGMGFLLGGNENVLELDSGHGGTALRLDWNLATVVWDELSCPTVTCRSRRKYKAIGSFQP